MRVDGKVIGSMALAGAAFWLARHARRGQTLRGETALVTGGSRGFGYLVAERLLREGARVAICGRDPRSLARAHARLEERTGGEVKSITCDVADPRAVREMVERVVHTFGSIDVLVNNAAVIQVAPLDALTLDDFTYAMDVDFMGTVHPTLAVLPYMRRRGRGRIANITSIGGKVAVPHLLPYDCAKFAAVGFSEGLRAAVAKDGITVTTVVPGLMRTGSPVHVEFRGRPEKEYAWFALGDLLPLSAMSAERAADRTVRAIRRGEAEVTLSWQAKLLRFAHDVSPGGMSRLLGRVDQLLPDAGAHESARGRSLRGTLPGFIESALEASARRTNQLDVGPTRH